MKQSSVCVNRSQRGITIVEVLVATGLIGILASLIIPAVQSTRESSRAAQCQARLRALVVAAQGHEAATGVFPYTSTAFLNDTGDGPELFESESPHRHLMRYIDDSISNRIDYSDRPFPSATEGLPTFADTNAEVMSVQISAFLCPSDVGVVGGTNYRACMGPSVHVLNPETARKFGFPIEESAQTGAFVTGRSVRASEFRDGLSQTAMFSERVTGDGSPDDYDPFRDLYSPQTGRLATNDEAIETCRVSAIADPETAYSYMGYSWLIGGWLHTWYNHAATPNSVVPDCAGGNGAFIADGGVGLYTARSLHRGGVNVAFADGGVNFVSNSVDLQVWRAMSTRNGGELP